uniref:Uncharacterized protein n=1 Tax=Tanacetum cinerariifolium TaxID=118510 RepID=A0A699RT91_TANCI|nr:hypothetical protein [Tanacetum cinerariifolium]
MCPNKGGLKPLMLGRINQEEVNAAIKGVNVAKPTVFDDEEVFANMQRVGKGFLGVETPLFASMLVQPQPQVDQEEEEVEMPISSAPQSLTNDPSSPPQDPTPTPHATPS